MATPISWRLAIFAAISLMTVLAWFTGPSLGSKGQSLIGTFCFLGLALGCSANIRAVRLRTLLTGIALQIALGLLILKVPVVYKAFSLAGVAAKQFLDFSMDGAKFVFGPLVNVPALEGGLSLNPGSGVVFAFVVLPTVVFVSSVFSVLYHIGILTFVVRIFARAMRFVMGTSGAETLSVTASVLIGQSEAPLIVKPFIPRMTRSELLSLMIGGMAHISGALMAVYINMGADPVAILATSVMAAPASLYFAKLLRPEIEHPETLGDVKPVREKLHANLIDAAAAGASQGMQLALNIAAMLIAFLSFIAMFNYLLGQIDPTLSMQSIFAKLFSPVAVLMGIQGDDIPKVGELLGTKLVVNEFVAFASMTSTYRPGTENGLSTSAFILTSFALTGFANFASIGIQLGGIGSLAPDRRSDLAKLGLTALLGGFLATLMNAAVANLLGAA